MPTPPQNSRPPLAEAVEWFARITTISLEMVLPGIAGHWFDQRQGTGYWAPIGFTVGLTVAVWHMVQLARAAEQNEKQAGKRKPPDNEHSQDTQDKPRR